MKKVKTIPAMSPEIVHEYLYDLGKSWKGKGIAVELGSWLGATAVPLLKGLKGADYDMPFYAYDRWQANADEVRKAKEQGIKIKDGQDIRGLFLENIKKVYDGQIYANKGNIQALVQTYKTWPIEICLFDAPKSDPTFTQCINSLSPYWIEGVTILGLMDYYFYEEKKGIKREKLMRPVRFMEDNKECFTKLEEWPGKCECVFFRYEKKLKKI